jgi:hypothetical protein
MTKSEQVVRSDLSAGDVAVDGLFSGALAGVPMAVYAAAVWLLFDSGAGDLFGEFLADRGMSLINTLLLHLAISSVYGLVFSLGYNFIARLAKATPTPWASIVAGMVYGALLLALAHLVILPANASPLQLSFGLSVPAHLIYGASLGALVHRDRFNPVR